MISETALEITETHHRWRVEIDRRYARRRKVRHIDRLINQLEMLNLADALAMPGRLGQELKQFLADHEHPLGSRSFRRLTIAETMEALYQIQDNLLLGGLEGEED